MTAAIVMKEHASRSSARLIDAFILTGGARRMRQALAVWMIHSGKRQKRGVNFKNKCSWSARAPQKVGQKEREWNNVSCQTARSSHRSASGG